MNATWRTRRTISLGALAAIAALLSLGVTSFVWPGAEASEPAIELASLNSREEALSTYYDVIAPAEKVAVGWTGDAASCRAGQVSAETTTGALAIVNAVRDLAGLGPVTFDAGRSQLAQEAALVMHANNQLSHAPPSSWTCWSQAGFDGASRSNLYLGVVGTPSIVGWMVDPGSNNLDVGHRRSILSPLTQTMGFGSTSRAAALHVIDDYRGAPTSPSWIAWPTPGAFPVPLEPDGRWSLSAPEGGDVDFSSATVSVTGPGGPESVTRHPSNGLNYGNLDSLVWQVSSLAAGAVRQATYRVVVSGVTIAGAAVGDIAYQVDLVDRETTPTPTPTPFTPLSRAA